MPSINIDFHVWPHVFSGFSSVIRSAEPSVRIVVLRGTLSSIQVTRLQYEDL